MSVITGLEKRRSRYLLNKELPVAKEKVEEVIKRVTELVPDAFDMKSARVVAAFGEEHEALWDEIERVFEGKVPHDKIQSFRNGAGTILYFYEEEVVDGLAAKFPTYAANFPVWANHANGMLQISIWTALAELGIGASLQHYNPIIDEMVRERYKLPKTYRLVAQMPFGGIEKEPEAKAKEKIEQRVQIV